MTGFTVKSFQYFFTLKAPIKTARDDTFCDSSLGPLDFSFETIHLVSYKAGIKK